jgi:hypothetical protein
MVTVTRMCIVCGPASYVLFKAGRVARFYISMLFRIFNYAFTFETWANIGEARSVVDEVKSV